MTKNLLLSDTSAAAIQKLNRLGYVDPSVSVVLETIGDEIFWIKHKSRKPRCRKTAQALRGDNEGVVVVDYGWHCVVMLSLYDCAHGRLGEAFG